MSDERNWARIFWGLALILVGAMFTFDRLGWLPKWGWTFTWWPLIVIALGLARLIQPRTASDVGSGVSTSLMGMWFLLVTGDILGLTWRNSWPLALVAVGAGTVARALAAYWLPDRRWSSRWPPK